MGILNTLSMLGVFAATQLPAGYTRVEYLRATGTQYIDTLWTPRADYELTIDYNFLTTENQCLYGRKSYSPLFRSDFVMIYGAMLVGYNATSEAYNGTGVILGKQKIVVKNKKIYRNGAELTLCGPPSDDWSIELTYFLFARNQRSAQFLSKAEIGYFKADDGITSCELYPCLDDKGRPCFYDVIRNITLYNQGSDEFIAGPPIL